MPDVYAAGDVARWINPWNGRSTRLEHWTSTGEQAEVAVRNALANGARPSARSCRTSGRSGTATSLQMLGEPADEVELAVAGGATDPFLAQYRYDGHLVGGFSLDQTGPLMKLRRAIAARASWEDVLNGIERTPSP